MGRIQDATKRVDTAVYPVLNTLELSVNVVFNSPQLVTMSVIPPKPIPPSSAAPPDATAVKVLVFLDYNALVKATAFNRKITIAAPWPNLTGYPLQVVTEINDGGAVSTVTDVAD
jgi:hypothetical protein